MPNINIEVTTSMQRGVGAACILLRYFVDFVIVHISLLRYNGNNISFQEDFEIMNGMTTKEAAVNGA